MENRSPVPTKVLLVESISAALVFSASLYFWFLQPLSFISKGHLLVALLIWLVLSAILYVGFSLFHKHRAGNTGNLILAMVVALLLAVLLNALVIRKERVPYNLFLLPRQEIVIEIEQSDVSHQVELTGFYNGLAPVSYDALELQGNWSKVDASILRYSGKDPARLVYSGWMVEDHFIEFLKQPQAGELVIHWNDTVQYADLDSDIPYKIRLDYPFQIAQRSKDSVVVLTFLSTCIILYPLIRILLDKLTGGQTLIDLERWMDETTPSVKKFTTIVSALCILASILLVVSPLLNRDGQVTQIEAAATADSPNVFIIIMDALTAEDMSLFGYELDTTPHLNEITGAWTVYTNAQSPSICSIGVYPSLVSGHYPYIMRPFADYGNLIRTSDAWVDLFQILSNDGYTTYWNGYLSPGFYHTGSGVDETFASSSPVLLLNTWFQAKAFSKTYFPYVPLSYQQPADYDSIQSADDRLSQTMQLFTQNAFQSPFFMYLHYDGVHVLPGIEWIYPAGASMGTFLSVDEGNSGLDKTQLRLRYDETIRDQDLQISKFIEELKIQGLFDNSLIILMADHGQSLKAGQYAQCSLHINLAETHVPLLVKYPNQQKGQVVNNLVTTIDLTPTILDVLDIPYEKNWFDGISLLDVAGLSAPRYVFSGNTFNEMYQHIQTVMDERYKLVFRDDRYFLYDYQNDPLEENDLFAQYQDQPFVQDMLSALQAHLDMIIR
ncbi:MAG: sulfatase-like hydrolase/transferase [Chloroflexi bacterium]|nr:sulfatase-like hydrolase/transferase [Chloroflexota bacterium]